VKADDDTFSNSANEGDTGLSQRPTTTAVFERAKSAASTCQVLTNYGKAEERKTHVNPAKKKLTRAPFTVSRLMKFCTRRELVNQTGHDVFERPLVVLKEVERARPISPPLKAAKRTKLTQPEADTGPAFRTPKPTKNTAKKGGGNADFGADEILH
jgi:hypothetical protein